MSNAVTPKPTGEYAVGTFTYTVYDAVEETMYNALGTKRSIPARVYYPATKESVKGLTKARYLTREMVSALKKQYMVPLSYDKAEKEGSNRSECYENAPFIEGSNFPLILFSHGYGSFREANSYLLCELASHGYWVVSVGHPHEGMLTELDNGTSYKVARKISSHCYSPFFKSVSALKKMGKAQGTNEELWQMFDSMQRTYNRFIMERIAAWETDTRIALKYLKENFYDRINWENGVGVTGHSAGGATAFALCEDEPETFTCGINIDSGLFGDHDGKSINVPFLQMNCEPNKSSVTWAFVKNRKTAYHAVFKDMQHLGFSDMKFQIPMPSMVGKLEPNVAHNEMCRIHLEFFDSYLKHTKEKPSFVSNDTVTFTEYPPVG